MAVWAALVTAVHAVANATGVEPATCLLHRFVGIPCPTCGGTRGTFLVLAGDPGAALTVNPLLFGVLFAGAALLLLRILTARRFEVSLSAVERRAAVAGGIALVLADWAYLVVTGA